MARPKAPSRSEVEAKLRALLAGDQTRAQIAQYAERWIMARNPDVSDAVVWAARVHLVGADLKTTDRPYLHGPEDFQAWLDELLAGSTPDAPS